MIDLETQKRIQADISSGKGLGIKLQTVGEVCNTICKIEQAARLVSLSENSDAEKLLGDHSVTDCLVTHPKELPRMLTDILDECYVCSDDPVKEVEGPIVAVLVAYIAYPDRLIVTPVIAVRVGEEVYTNWDNLT